MNDSFELALALIRTVRGAMARGVRHYSKDGRFLATDAEVLEALNRDGEIRIEGGD